MGAVDRVCSECGASLKGKAPSAKTCSVNCRSARSRRRKGLNDDLEVQAAERTVAQIVQREGEDVVMRMLKQELQPVVREAITEEVMRAISNLVSLTPQAVVALAADLESDDAVLRQRAASLVVRYTIGHPALVKPAEDEAQPFQVIFQLPRPADSGEAPAADQIEADAEVIEETRICDTCGKEKAAAEFVGGSDRCQSCFDEIRARVLKEFT